jgi:glycosyltransferase involved in cell wall biosynthesis
VATPLVSVAIPCYEMGGRGAEFLEYSLERIAEQTYPRVEAVVADHSRDDEVRRTCDAWRSRLNLRYVRNTHKRGSSSANANIAIKNSSGDLVKILCQDDYLYQPDSLDRTVSAIGDGEWLVSSYLHTDDRQKLFRLQNPRLSADIAVMNTIGTHSCLTIRNRAEPELFNEDLIWLMDCEYYRRLYDRLGEPAILLDPTVVHMLWEGQVTNTIATEERRRAEYEHVRHLYAKPIPGLPNPSRPSLRLRLARRIRWLM